MTFITFIKQKPAQRKNKPTTPSKTYLKKLIFFITLGDLLKFFAATRCYFLEKVIIPKEKLTCFLKALNRCLRYLICGFLSLTSRCF